MNTISNRHGFTRTELIVVLFVVGVLVSLTIPIFTGAVIKPIVSQSLSHAKQIYLATWSMEEDRKSLNDMSIGLPGDLVASGTMSCKVTDFVKLLVNRNYLKVSDLAIFSINGIAPFKGSDVNEFSARAGTGSNCAYTVYCIQESDTDNAIFLSTINAVLDVSNTTFVLDAKAAPFGNKGYVIFHKGGDGIILGKSQASNPALQGTPCKMALSGTAALRAE